jgi:hypothetical protein
MQKPNQKKAQLKQINKNAAKPPPPPQQQHDPQNQITKNVAKPTTPTTPTTTDHQLQAERSF